MNSQRLAIMPVLFALVMISFGPAFAQDSSTSTMTVGGTCGISIVSPMSFGNVIPGDISVEQELQITGEGSTSSDFSVFATNWIDVETGDNIVNGEKTKFSSIEAEVYDDKLSLNATDTTIPIGNVVNQETYSTYWEVELILNDVTFQGAVEQELTFVVDDCV